MNKSFLILLTITLISQLLWGDMDNQTRVVYLKEKVKKFVDERGWDKEPAHSVRDISTSIICEAAELMEIFKWQPESDIPVTINVNMREIKNETADVAFALLDFCNQLNIDLSDALDEKMVLHAKKYPANEPYSRTNNIDSSTTISVLKSKMKQFCDQRNWHHNAKILSMDVVGEAAELLEIFNWKTEKEIEQTIKEKMQDIRYEVADIAFALLSFCNELDIDLSSAMEEKIKINALKYPIKT